MEEVKKVKGNAAILQAVGSTPAKIKESREALKAYCDKEGLPILHTIDFCTNSFYLDDFDSDGGNNKGEEIPLEEMAKAERSRILECLDRGDQIAHVVTQHFNNLFDNVLNSLVFLDQLEVRGVKVHCLDLIEGGCNIYSPEGRMVLTCLLGMYENFEKLFTKER
jgi:DNA invertase Pin-like site-specific DNA recombinase